MTDLDAPKPKRKLLSLKLGEPDIPYATPFVESKEAVFMVWNAGGEMPKRVYTAQERDRAIGHAKMLAREHGQRFYVLRAWRGYDPA